MVDVATIATQSIQNVFINCSLMRLYLTGTGVREHLLHGNLDRLRLAIPGHEVGILFHPQSPLPAKTPNLKLKYTPIARVHFS